MAAPEAADMPIPGEEEESAPPPMLRRPGASAGQFTQIGSREDAARVAQDSVARGNMQVADAYGKADAAVNNAADYGGESIDAQAEFDRVSGEIRTREQGLADADELVRDVDYKTIHEKTQAKAKQLFDDDMRAGADFANTRTYNWWAKAGTGATILGIISQALSGAAQGMSGDFGGATPLDRVIESDYQQQSQVLQQKGQVAQNARGAYKDILEQSQDETVAYLQMKRVALESTSKRIDAMIAASPEAQQAKAKANSLGLKAEIAQKLSQTISALETHRADQAGKEGIQEAGIALGLVKDEGKAEASKERLDIRKAEEQRKQNELTAPGWEHLKKNPDGSGVFYGKAGDAEKLRNGQAQGAGLVRNYDKLIELLKRNQWNDESFAAANQISSQLSNVGKSESFYNFGASVTEGEMAKLLGAMGTGDLNTIKRFLSANGINRLKSGKDEFKSQFIQKMASHGIRPTKDNEFVQPSDYVRLRMHGGSR